MDRPPGGSAQPVEDMTGAWALRDLHEAVAGGLEAAQALLTAGEVALARRILGLGGPAGRTYARLAARSGALFRPGDLAGQGFEAPESTLAELAALDLVHGALPRRLRAGLLTADELRVALRALGQPTRGRRAELEERALAQPGWEPPAALRLAGRDLVRRLERLWLRGPWQDRSLLVRERVGVLRWPGFEPCPGPPPLRTRAQLLRMEALWAGALPAEPELTLAWIAAEPVAEEPGGPFDARRALRHHLAEQLRGLERAGEAARAAALYRAALVALPRGDLSLRLALALEAAGDRAGALAACEEGLAWARPAERLALGRTGRRLARALGRSWRAEAPLRAAAERELLLPAAAGAERRLRWGGEGLPIELACVAAVAPRAAIWGENTLWTTLFGLLFADLYGLPVPGMLPTRLLAGPLDLGTPAFAARRAGPVRARLEALGAGEGAALLARHHTRYAGCALAGVRWELAPLPQLVDVVEGLGPRALCAAVQLLLDQGWAAARGLPDLVVLPGPAVRLPGGLPAQLPEALLLAEVKGPSDSLRDEQRVWHDQLLAAGVRVELWRVKEQA